MLSVLIHLSVSLTAFYPLPPFLLPHTQRHYGGSFIFTMTRVLSAHSFTHTHALVVSGGPVTGCSVYYGEDVKSCRLKSLTSRVPTGGLYYGFTDWSKIGQIVCSHGARSGVDSRIMCPILSSVWLCMDFPPRRSDCNVSLSCFSFSNCDFLLILDMP